MDIAEIAARCSGKATGGAAKAARPRRTGGGRRSTASAEKLQKATDGHAGRSAYRITLLRGCRKGRQAPSCAIRSGRPSKNLLGRLGGPKPSNCNPNPATCAAGSEILRSKVSLHVSPAAPPGAGETCPGGKGRQRRPFSTSRSGCKPLPLSCSGRALCAQEHDVPFAARLRNSLAAKNRRQTKPPGKSLCRAVFFGYVVWLFLRTIRSVSPRRRPSSPARSRPRHQSAPRAPHSRYPRSPPCRPRAYRRAPGPNPGSWKAPSG